MSTKTNAVIAGRLKRVLRGLFVSAPTVLLVYLVVVPIVLLLLSGFKPGGMVAKAGFTLSNYIEVYSDPGTWRLLGNTLVFATGAVLVTLFFSTSLAWLIERTNIPLKNWLRIAIVGPMAVPMMITAMGWVILASPKIGFFNIFLMEAFDLSKPPFNLYSFPGMIIVQGLVGVPSAFLLLSIPFRNMDPAFEDASMVSGAGVLKTLRRILLPILRPAVLGVAVIMFMYALATFDVPGVIGLPAGIKLFSLNLYLAVHQAEGVPEIGQVSALASVFFVAILILTYVYNQQTRLAAKFTTITGREFRPKILDLKGWKYPATACVLIYILFVVVLPLAALTWESLVPYYTPFSLDSLHLASWDNYRSIMEHPMIALAVKNTIIVGVVSAFALVFLATVISWLIVRSRFRARRLLDLLSMLPLALPHIMLGLSLIIVYLTFKVGVYGTIWAIIIAFVTTYLSYSTRLINSTMFQIHKELEEAAQVSGAAVLRVFRTIIVPLLAPSLIGLWVWVFIHAIRELSAALMLQSYKSLVMTTLMWNFWNRGNVPQVATVGVLMVATLFVVMGLGQLISGQFGLAGSKA